MVIVSGIGDNEFNYLESILRQDMMLIIKRVISLYLGF